MADISIDNEDKLKKKTHVTVGIMGEDDIRKFEIINTRFNT
jgi:hypothetical protein